MSWQQQASSGLTWGQGGVPLAGLHIYTVIVIQHSTTAYGTSRVKASSTSIRVEYTVIIVAHTQWVLHIVHSGAGLYIFIDKNGGNHFTWRIHCTLLGIWVVVFLNPEELEAKRMRSLTWFISVLKTSRILISFAPLPLGWTSTDCFWFWCPAWQFITSRPSTPIELLLIDSHLVSFGHDNICSMNISKPFSILESAPVGWSFGNSNCPTLRQIENRPSNSGNSGGPDDSSTSDSDRDTGLTDQFLKRV